MKRLLFFFILFITGGFANEVQNTELDYSIGGYTVDSQKVSIEEIEKYIPIEHELHDMYLSAKKMDKVATIALITTTSMVVIGTTTSVLSGSEHGKVLQIVGLGSAFISLPLGVVSSVKHNNLVREYNGLSGNKSIAVHYNGETVGLQYSFTF